MEKTIAFGKLVIWGITENRHAIYDLKYFLVWITKYQKKILKVAISERLRELVREICKVNDIEIKKGYVA